MGAIPSGEEAARFKLTLKSWQEMRKALGAEHADRLLQLRLVLQQTADNHPGVMPADEELVFIVQCSLVWIAALDAVQNAMLELKADLDRAVVERNADRRSALANYEKFQQAEAERDHYRLAMENEIRVGGELRSRAQAEITALRTGLDAVRQIRKRCEYMSTNATLVVQRLFAKELLALLPPTPEAP
jgi:hypothetical protein